MYVLSHILIFILWCLFGFFHSWFATSSFKLFAFRKLKINEGHFKLYYSGFAIVSMAMVIVYQLSLNSSYLFKPNLFINITAVLLFLFGIIIMFVAGRHYFWVITGLHVLVGKPVQTELKRNGLHRHIRHPLYLGTLICIGSIFLYFPTLANLLSFISITLYVRVGIFYEEQKLIKEYGKDYLLYKKQVPMIFPKIF